MQTRELLEKKQQLILQSAVLRVQLEQNIRLVTRPFIWLNKVQNGLHWLRQHPQWPIATITLLVVVRPRQTFKWGNRLWWAWSFYRNLQLNLSTLKTPLQRHSS